MEDQRQSLSWYWIRKYKRTAFSSKPLRVSIVVSSLPDSMVEIEIRIIYLVSKVLAGIIVIYFRAH